MQSATTWWRLQNSNLVPVAGVEPARYRYHWILSPARLPIPSHRRLRIYYIINSEKCKINFSNSEISFDFCAAVCYHIHIKIIGVK